jgi:DNA-binding transcriptional ArsR family regulator
MPRRLSKRKIILGALNQLGSVSYEDLCRTLKKQMSKSAVHLIDQDINTLFNEGLIKIEFKPAETLYSVNHSILPDK